MAKGRKNSNFQREKQLKNVAELYLERLDQEVIAQRLGISQQQVSYDVGVLRKRWQESQIEKVGAVKQEELARIDRLEAEYWLAWRRSLEEKTRTKTAKIGEKTTAFIEKETTTGVPAFLAGVQWCISERLRIRGGYAPTQNRSLDFDMSQLTDEQLDRVAAGEDLIQVLLGGRSTSDATDKAEEATEI